MSGNTGVKNGYSSARGSIINDIPAERTYLAIGYTDMRMSLDGLAAIVQQVFKHDSNTRNLYLFCGKRSDRLKALFYDGDGYILLYKRLENAKFQWPRRGAEAKLLTERQLRWLLEGLSIEQPKAIKAIEPKIII
jgi:transposase